MARYIDADELTEEIKSLKISLGGKDILSDRVKESILRIIDEQPTADVVEVKHGQWYRHNKKEHGDTCYYCSVCEKMALADCLEWELTKYCPHCGAKMDGGNTK